MSKIYNLYVECYLDSMFIKKLGFEPNSIHQSNAHVIRCLMKLKTKVLGIIDKDKAKNKASDLNKFILQEEDKANMLEFYKYENRHIIKVCRDIENWLFHCNNQLDNPIEFPYGSVDGLRKKSKNRSIEKDSIIDNFLNTLIQKNPPAIQKLKKCLTIHFRDNY